MALREPCPLLPLEVNNDLKIDTYTEIVMSLT